MSVVCPIFVIQICRQAAMFWLNISWVASVLLPFLLYMLWAKVGDFLFVQLGNWLDQGILWVPDWAQLLASRFTAHLNFRPIRVPYFRGGFFDLLCEPIFVLARRVSELAFSSFCLVSAVRPQHSALPLILFVFIHDFASLTQVTHSFHFHAYLMSRSPICYFN